MTRLVVARHGDTFEPGELPRRIGARTDLSLTANGRAQATRLGHALAAAGLTFGRVLAGPLARAQQTARLALDAMETGSGVVAAPMLDEVDHGPDEDRPETMVLERLGRPALDLWETRAVAPDGWVVDAPARLAWWRDLLAAPPPGDTLLVTSNGAARFALLALEAAVLPHALKLRTGAFGLLVRDEGGAWTITRWDERP